MKIITRIIGTVEITVTSDISQEIEISCCLSNKNQTVSFNSGETKTVQFTIQ